MNEKKAQTNEMKWTKRTNEQMDEMDKTSPNVNESVSSIQFDFASRSLSGSLCTSQLSQSIQNLQQVDNLRRKINLDMQAFPSLRGPFWNLLKGIE